MNDTENMQAENSRENEYLVKSTMRSLGLYPSGDGTEEQSNYVNGLTLMAMMMEGRMTTFTHEGQCLEAKEAARIAADAWDADPDKLLALALEWEPLLKLRRDDPDRYRTEIAKRFREMSDET